MDRADRRLGQTALALMGCGVIAALWMVIPHPVVVVGAALVPLVCLLALRQPFLMVLAFVVFSFFRIHEVFPQLYPLRIPQLLALGTLASLAFNFATHQIKMYWQRELSAFSVFFVLVTIGVFLATNRGEAMGSWSGTYVKIAIMVFAIAWLSQSSKSFRIMLLTMIAAGIVVGVVTLLNKVNGVGLVEGTRVTIGRDIGSMLGDPNDLSLVLLFPASFALSLFFTRQTGWFAKVLGISGFVVVLCAIVATQSRGGLLGITAVMSVYGYRTIKNKALFFMIGAIVLMALFVAAGVNDRASGGAHEEGIDESAMGRLYAWEAAISMGISRPLTGVGINNFISNYFMHSSHWDGKNHAVHSTWFGVLAESGVLGLAAFLTMIAVMLRNGLQSIKKLAYDPKRPDRYDPWASAMSLAVFGGLVGFCTSGTFLTMGYTWPVYILLALNAAVSQFASRQSRNVSQIANQEITGKLTP